MPYQVQTDGSSAKDQKIAQTQFKQSSRGHTRNFKNKINNETSHQKSKNSKI
jgi:hypothetical protein